jgi:hypothetical protein
MLWSGSPCQSWEFKISLLVGTSLALKECIWVPGPPFEKYLRIYATSTSFRRLVHHQVHSSQYIPCSLFSTLFS